MLEKKVVIRYIKLSDINVCKNIGNILIKLLL